MTTLHAARRHVAQWLTAGVVQGGVVASCLVGCASAGVYRVSGQLKSYEIMVTGHDSVSTEVAAAFGRRGFRVRGAVRGGSHPTLAYVAFWFSEPGEGKQPQVYYARLADTRTGGILAAAAVTLDSLGPSLKSRIDSLVTLLTAPLPLTP